MGNTFTCDKCMKERPSDSSTICKRCKIKICHDCYIKLTDFNIDQDHKIYNMVYTKYGHILDVNIVYCGKQPDVIDKLQWKLLYCK